MNPNPQKITNPYSFNCIPVPNSMGGGLMAYCPDLPGCISYGSDFIETARDVMLAAEGWIELALKNGEVVPKPLFKFTFQNAVDVPGLGKINIGKPLYPSASNKEEEKEITYHKVIKELLGIEAKP